MGSSEKREKDGTALETGGSDSGCPMAELSVAPIGSEKVESSSGRGFVRRGRRRRPSILGIGKTVALMRAIIRHTAGN